MSFNPDGIAIHHSAGQDTDEDNWVGIQRYHSKKWDTNTTGYHHLIEKVDLYYDAFNPRDEGQQGIHVKGHNGNYIGFCFVGDFSDTEPPQLQLETGAVEIARSMIRNHIAYHKIKPHHEITEPGHTECPGESFPTDELRRMVGREYTRFVVSQDQWPVHVQQNTLNMIGIDAGPVDNIEGNKTKQARRNFSSKLDVLDKSAHWTKKMESAAKMELRENFLSGDDSGLPEDVKAGIQELQTVVNHLNSNVNSLLKLTE